MKWVTVCPYCGHYIEPGNYGTVKVEPSLCTWAHAACISKSKRENTMETIIDGVTIKYNPKTRWIIWMSDWDKCEFLAKAGHIERRSFDTGGYGFHTEFYVKEVTRCKTQ